MPPYLRKVPVFFLGGQSNAEGRGLNSDLPADHLGPYSDCEIFNLNTNAFEPLEIGVNNKTLSPTPAGVHGPEVTLFKSLRDLIGEPCFFIKVAMDATSLAPVGGPFNDWGPGASDLAVGAIAVFALAAADLATRGLAIDLRASFWQQGENDSFVLAQANAYLANNLALFTYWRAQYAALGYTSWRDGLVPFICGKIHTDFAASFIGTVNAAKVGVAEQLPNVFLVETDDLPTIDPDPPHPAKIHFTSAGQVELGLRFARAFALVPAEEFWPQVESITVAPESDALPTIEEFEPQYEGGSDVLVPRGLAWTEDRDSNLRRLLRALSTTWARIGLRAAELELEFDPATASELLGEWERLLGIPGECGELAPTLVLRRAAAAAKLAFKGGQNEAFFIQLAKTLGFEVEVIKYDGTTCNDDCNDFLAGAEWVFAWKVRAPVVTPFFFRSGASVSGERLTDTNNALLECYIRDAKPAQSFVLFSYDLDVPVTAYLPWEFVQPGFATAVAVAPIVTTVKTGP